MCHEDEEWCKTWRGIEMSFQNWNEEFNKFWPEQSKVSKICTLMNPFGKVYVWTKKGTEE